MIEGMEPPNGTFREFLSKKVDLDGLQLGKTFVGKFKDNLDPVTPDLVAADVMSQVPLGLALFVDHPVFHQKQLTRYPSFSTPSLKQMATITF